MKKTMLLDPLLDFSDQSIIVTGAASGFGALLAQMLDARGASLVLGDINESGLQDTASNLKSAPTTLVGDVADETYASALVEAAVKQNGKLDIALNNAGIAPPELKTIAELDLDVLEQQLQVNAKGVALGMKYQLRAMAVKKSGSILNVSSMAGVGGAPMIASYAAAKHAVVGLTKSAAVEFAKLNIRVNAICPFFAATPMVDNPLLNPTDNLEDVNSRLAAGCPMKRIGTVEEMVNVMVMLISPQNTYMSGQAIMVDGATSAW